MEKKGTKIAYFVALGLIIVLLVVLGLSFKDKENPVFIGGGSILMRPVIESELGRDDYLFIGDPRANAIGYKMMAESKLAAENR